jgi:hypothetical protein
VSLELMEGKGRFRWMGTVIVGVWVGVILLGAWLLVKRFVLK